MNEMDSSCSILSPFAKFSGLERFDHHIKKINQREVTYESDRVNTIMGILGILQDRQVLAGHLCGIPIFSERFHINALTWESSLLCGFWILLASTQERRTQFPSWSWAGWNDTATALFHSPVTTDDVRTKVELESSQIIPSKEFQQLARNNGLPKSAPKFIH